MCMKLSNLNTEDFNNSSGRWKMNKKEINGKNNFKIFIIFPCSKVLMKGMKNSFICLRI